MYSKQFHVLMKEKRLARGLTQTAAARMCGLSKRRWSALERGYRRPNDAEFRGICGLLKIGNCFVSPAGATKQLLNLGALEAPVRKPFYSHQDRPTYVRHRTCLNENSHARYLRDMVRARVDAPLCEHLAHRISCDSHLESLFVSYLLARGARPTLTAPLTLAHIGAEIVDDRGRESVGARPRPCLVLGGKHYFFQVSFLVSRVVRFDVLCWDGAKWSLIELNGRGHDYAGDTAKAIEIRLPLNRISECDLHALIRSYILPVAS